jgi:hypothetical protein
VTATLGFDWAGRPEEDDYLPPPYTGPPTIGERLRPIIDAASASSFSAALLTIIVVAVVVLAVALQPARVDLTDDAGPLRAECGLSYFLVGHPNDVVEDTCRERFAGRAVVALLALGIAGSSSIFLMLRATRNKVNPDAHRPAMRGVALGLAIAAAVVGAGSLRTVPVAGTDRDGPITIHCGASYYFAGHPDPAVADACSSAFGTHALLLRGSIAALLASAAALWVMRARSTPQPVAAATDEANQAMNEPNEPSGLAREELLA